MAWAQAQPSDERFDWGARLRLFAQRTYGWDRLSMMAADSGLDYLLDEPKEWGQAPQTLASRYSARFGKRLVRNSVELGVGGLLGEDTRFRPSGLKGVRPRVWFALQHAVLTHDNHVAWSRAAGTAAGSLVSSTWYPYPGGLTAGRIIDGLLSGLMGQVQTSFETEFESDVKAAGKRLFRKLRRPSFTPSP